MPLPKIDVPTYEIVLPVSKKKIKFRPFLVKEQKNLLMAIEAQDSSSVYNAIRDVLINCTLSEINVDDLPVIDIEYYFINLRAKSVGEVVESKYRCNNEVEGKECGNLMDSKVNLLDMQVDMRENIDPEINLTDTITMKMKYPQFSMVRDSLNYEDASELTFNMVTQSIDHIYDGEQYYYGHEVSLEEKVDFIESLNQEQFSKLELFFNNLPRLRETVDITCSKCGFHHKIDVEGLESFFD